MAEEARIQHGREKEMEADDPMALVWSPVPGGDPKLMATCLIEEYARLGMNAEEILSLFRDPAYRTHALYQEQGEGWIRRLIGEVLARSGQMRISVTVLHHIGGGDA